MTRLALCRCRRLALLLVLLASAEASAQEPFDFETFGAHVEQARTLYEAARALDDTDEAARRTLLIESGAAQEHAAEMLREALDAGVFQGVDRDEAEARLLELEVGIVTLTVETGRCAEARDQLESALSARSRLPDGGGAELERLRPSVDACVDEVAEAEPAVEPEAPAAGPDEPLGLADTPRRRRQPLVTTAWVTGSLAVACAGAALGFYLHTQSLQSDLDAEVDLPRFDPDRAQALWSDVEDGEMLTNVFLWSGVALAATTAVLVTIVLVTDDEETVVVPAPVEGGALLGVAGRF